MKWLTLLIRIPVIFFLDVSFKKKKIYKEPKATFYESSEVDWGKV